ncbi:hypothetical protein [Pseudomonas fluorescens]|uniref:hypothetical protein n=1 Tax=Pseudomonas fluorescens TaxID=294 RepID=UPI0006424A20|nr:hypothetical protein [Pseudomonas fluorescens]
MSDATKYGKELWLLLAPTFDQATALDGFGNHPEKAQAFAGFIAAVCGGMFAQTGYESTMAVLAAIAQELESVNARSEVKH